MAETELTTKIRRWGNSYGILISQEALQEQGFEEGEEVDAIILKKENILKETFGKHTFSKPTKQLLKEIDKELYDL
ncbi:MAG: hypothetical protein AABY00_03295 [Nanoarchaeota archaeon]